MGEESQHSSVSDTFIEKLRAVVLEHYSEDQFGVSDLVELYGLSRSQLHRKLKAATGQSISQFIREIRLDEALKLLQQEDVTASEVSYKVGFNSPTYFNTCFNEYFGYPPGEAKHHTSDEAVGSSLQEPRLSGNKRLLLWLGVVAILVMIFFGSKYLRQQPSEANADTTAKPKTIAVLPFKNWSGDPELEYVSDGMTDAVITRLSRISDIEKVVPFSTVISYKNSDKVASEIAKELNVAYILEGNFKLSGHQVMSNLNLIEVSNNEFIWSLEYTGTWKADEIFEMQASVAENVAENMEVNLSKREIAEINSQLTTSEEAYRLFLEAQYQHQLLSLSGFEDAEKLFKKAIEIDPSFIEPYLGLASTYLTSGLVWGGMTEATALEGGMNYYKKAFEINQNRNLGYDMELVGLKMFIDLHYNWDIPAMEQNLKFMMHQERFNSYSFGMMVDYCRKTGRFEDALRFAKKAVEANVVDLGYYNGLASAYYFADNPDGAMRTMKLKDVMEYNSYFHLMESSKIFYYLKAKDESMNQLGRFRNSYEDRPPQVLWLIAVHASLDNNSDEVNSALAGLEESFQMSKSGSPAWFLAMYYCHMKEYDTAFEWLQKSYDSHEVEMMWLKEEPLLRPLRTDPRYIELYNEIGFNLIEHSESP